MAGIGFPLLKIYERDTLRSKIAVIGHAMFIASGPSLLTTLCFLLISLLTRGSAAEEIVAFRVAAVYAFGIGLVSTAPIVLVAVRLVSDGFSRGDYGLMRGAYCVTAALSVLSSSTASVLIYGSMSGWDIKLMVSAGLLSALISAVFVAVGFATAVREFRAITAYFVIGTFTSLVLTLWAIMAEAGVYLMLGGFHAGFIVVFLGVTHRVFAGFPLVTMPMGAVFRRLLALTFRQQPLIVGGFAGAAAIWIDKVVIWLSPLAIATQNGLQHAPAYDSSMFIGYLVLLPCLSVFLVLSESEFFIGFRRYQSTITGRGTQATISVELGRLTNRVSQLIFQLTAVQLAISATIAIAAPLLVEMFGLSYTQIPIIRFTVMAAAFQFAFLASAAVILFVGDVRSFAAVQVLFLSLNFVLTVGVQLLAPELLGFGYMAACMVAAAFAFMAQERSISDLTADIFARA